MNDTNPQHPVHEKYARRALLAECFNSFFELAPDEVLEFDRLMAQQSAEAIEMVNSFEASGQRKGKLTILRLQLEKKFGALSPPASDRLSLQSTEQMAETALALPDAASLKELGLADEESPGT